MVCTQTSGVGFEAMLHRTPTVLFARPDYHHCAIRVASLADTAQAVQNALESRFFYARYIYWFLNENLFPLDSDEFDSRLRALLAEIDEI